MLEKDRMETPHPSPDAAGFVSQLDEVRGRHRPPIDGVDHSIPVKSCTPLLPQPPAHSQA